jgi:tRNA dimethylallyltransferase
MQAIGYRQVVEHLRGERGLSETVELVKSRTRQFAKRQMTWFRRHARAQCIGWKSGESSDAALAALLAGLPD